eukprot:TRINITY_DN15354_c0_g1_i1.p1 TRINITY_DN15354_c0_g1~~TRINITY_DN15354_c0_g1_i1.p1  ORF type:complete len:713 (+),score=162.60 TRINITY_DN15354_c0_g1_i1:39-2141(+)
MTRGDVNVAKQAVLDNVPKCMDEDQIDYLANLIETLVGDDDADPDSIRSDFKDAVVSFADDLDDFSADDADAFCEKVMRETFGSAGNAAVADCGESGIEVDADCLCNVPNLLLMYGGSPVPLLKSATLRLMRGHRYGVIGANGSGKTTLMAKIASKDILGFPQELGVVHLRHESILHGTSPKTTVTEYAEKKTGSKASEQDVSQALRDVGFDSEELLGKTVRALSGGWQMRLALACAMAQKASLLLLDEPTNHLDAAAVEWLVGWVNRTCVGGVEGGTAIIVSHDPAFLNLVCTDIIHFTSDAKLVYHPGDFEAFKRKELGGDDAKAQTLLSVAKSDESSAGGYAAASLSVPEPDALVFPAPEKLVSNGMTNPVVLTVSNGSFQHKGAEKAVLDGVNLEIRPCSRVAIVGKNGSGKSTLLSLLAGRLPLKGGELWLDQRLRVAYIEQHTESQLRNFMDCKPYEYLQLRFKRGYDSEVPQRAVYKPTPKEAKRIKEVARQHGKRGKEVELILSRQITNHTKGACLYEVQWKDLGPAENTFEKAERLRMLNVGYMVDEFNQMMNDAWGEAPERPLTDREVCRHLEDFGLSEDVARRSAISKLSSGQKNKLMLAASFWTRPHVVFLDEPTNALDMETVAALTQALVKFKGGYVVVSHNQDFVDEICEELWEVADGQVVVRQSGPESQASKAATSAKQTTKSGK